MDVQGNSQSGATDALSSLLQDVSALIGSTQSSGAGNTGALSPGGDAASLSPATPSQDQFSSQSQNPMQALGLILEGLGELLSMLEQGQSGQDGQGGFPNLGNGVADGGGGNKQAAPPSQGSGNNDGGFHLAAPGFSYQDGGKDGGFSVNAPGLSFGGN